MVKIHVLNKPDFKPLEFEGIKLVELDQLGLTCEG